MQFILTAYDATDDDAQNRRMAARQAHLETIEKFRQSGNMHMGAAICDEAGKMVGSCIVCEFSTRTELDAWLAEEPYLQQNVWGTVDVKECKIGPSFLK